MSSSTQFNPTSASSLTLKDALELALLAGNSVSSHWAQFYVITFGLVGWLTSSFARPDDSQAVVLAVGSVAYYTMNAMTTARAYKVLNLIILETAEISKRSVFLNTHVTQTIASIKPHAALPLRLPITLLAHLAAAATVTNLALRPVTQ